MNYRKLTCCLLPLLVLCTGLKADELSELRAAMAALQAENQSLKSQLAQTETQVEEQAGELEEIREEQRSERRELRQASAVGDGRDRAAGGNIAIGPFSFGGAIRANYTVGDYDNPLADGAAGGAGRDNNGTVSLDTFYLTSAFEYGSFIGAAEYRFYDYPGSFSGYHFFHTLWLGYEFDNGSTLKAGIVEVPFGLDRFGASYGFFNSLENYVGLSDDRDLGIVYSFAIDDFEIDLGYFYSAEPAGVGNSKNSARGSYDVLEPSGDAGVFNFATDPSTNNFINGNVSPWEEKHQFNARVKYNFYLGETENIVGASAQYGGLESTDPQDRFDDGHMYAGSIFMQSTWGNWQVKAGVTHYKYDVDQLKDKTKFFGTPFFTSTQGFNPDQIAVGGFDTPFYIASEGTIPSIGISYTYFPRSIDFIDFIAPYVDYSILLKKGETNGNYYAPVGDEFQDSEQLTFGAIIGSGNWLIYVDTILGKGSPLVGNENGQYFTGAALNDGGAAFDSGFQLRFNINVGYYF